MTREAWPWPWPEPRSHYDTSGPTAPIRFEYSGHRFYVESSGHSGAHTGRGRFTVICLSCGELVHPNTTGPQSWIKGHVRRHDVLSPRP